MDKEILRASLSLLGGHDASFFITEGEKVKGE